MITYRDVSVTYGNYTALKNLSFKINKGDFLHIIGPNGSGKTTLLKLLIGVLKPSTGHITINESFKMGYLPQNINIKTNFPMTVKEIIYSGFKMQRLIPKTNELSLIKKWLKKMEIPELYNSSIAHLSGGQQQRVFIIRALISNPDLVILDEPTSALDPEFRQKFYHLLYELQQNNKTTIIHVTHDLTDAVKDNCLTMYVDQDVKFFGTYKDYYNFEHRGHNHV